MREILPQLIRWIDADLPFAVATVTRTVGSTPKPPGAAVAVSANGDIIGGISAGCVESELIELANRVLAEHEPAIAQFGPGDDFGPGLSCGGTIDVVVNHSLQLAPRLLAASRSLTSGHDAEVEISPDFTVRLHPDPHMIICGATDVAIPMSQIGKLLGYRVTVVDARAAFATPERFPDVEIVVDWPHRYLDSIDVPDTAVLCSFAHDAKFAIPLLESALRKPFAYLGAMGSKRTCAEREDELRARGITTEQLARLHSPIGMDIGGRTPAEIAVSVAAQIVAQRR
ncbi:MAG: XdhC/CoxI family protein [Nocardiaceae bacterium]|nr:XdhC/CoxI family protein [Nocardiaceae bacterium]